MRRGKTAAHVAPLPVVAAAVAFVAAPVLLTRVGLASQDAVAPLLAEPGAARVVLGAIVALSALVGATVSLALPGRRGLGPEAAATPIDSRRLLAALWLAPLTLVLATAAPSALGLLLPLAASSPGGLRVAPALVVAGLAGGLVGAAVGEAARVARRGDRSAVPVVAALVSVWTLVGALGGTALAGPLADGGHALAGGGVGAALAAFAALGVTAAGCWVVLAPRQRSDRLAAGRRRVPPVRGRPPLVVLLCTLALVTRRTDMRLVLGTALLAGIGMLGVGRAAGAPASIAAVAALLTAALAAAPLALSAAGIALAGRRTWRTAPVPAVFTSAAWCAAGSLALLAATVPLALGLVAAGRLPADTLGSTAAIVAVIGSGALVAGAVIPWRAGGIGDQLPAIAALGVTLTVGAVLGSETGEALARLGLSDAAAGCATAMLAATVATAAVTLRLTRAT